MLPPRLLPAFVRLLFCQGLLAVATLSAQVERVVVATQTARQNERIDLSVILRAEFVTPYDSAVVALDVEVVSPTGRTTRTPAYYVEGASGQSSVWAARLVAPEAGPHTAVCVLSVKGVPVSRQSFTFAVQASDQRGFLRPRDAWSFRFDNGEVFRGFGYNICWESRNNDDSKFFKPLHENRRFNYDTMLGDLASNGGNFVRIWMCGWNFPLEWPQVWDTDRYAPTVGRFNLSAAQRMDQFVERLAATGVYAMVALDFHGGYLGGAWDRNAYNVANGGPARNATEFFTSPEARARYKDRLRYVVARWGYSPHVGAWEFFNEIDNVMYGAPERIPDAVITDWHREMSDYLRAIDPNRHLITTSISHRDVAGLNDLPSIDFNQKHIYGPCDNIAETVTRYAAAHAKPYVIGEYGFEWDWSKNFNLFAGDMDRVFRKGLWLGLFNPTPVLPLSWWWEFFDDRGTLGYVAKVERVSKEMIQEGGGRLQALPVEWKEAGVAAYGVRTGSTLWVLLSNTTAKPVSGRLGWAEAPSGAVSVEVYDPEAESRTHAQVVLAEKDWLVPASQDIILRFSL